MRIDDDAAAIVFLNSDSFETEPFGVRHAADRDQDHVGVDRPGGAAVDRLDLHLERLSGRVDAGDLRRQFESDALALLDALKLARDLAVETGQDVIQKLDDGDLGAKPTPYRAELHADDAGTDHEQRFLRHLGQIERAGRGHDAFLIDVDAGKPHATSEPVAMTMFLVSSVWALPSAALTSTLPGAAMRPAPWKASILFFLNRKSTPLTLLSTLPCLYLSSAARSMLSLSIWMPICAKLCPDSSYNSEACSIAFEGMQPTLRHVPPNVAHFSTTAVFSPSCAARMAHT